MSSKRRRAESSRSASSFDQSKFVSIAAAERYKNVIDKKSFVLERGLRPDPQLDGAMALMIAERNWENFVAQPGPAVISVVKEFYANAIEGIDQVVQVRGKPVSYSAETINAFFNVQNKRGSVSHYDTNSCNLDETMQYLCKPGTVWTFKANTDERVSFPHSALSKYGKAWYAFICANLMPTRHQNDVTKDRALLLHGIVRQSNSGFFPIFSVDIGYIIEQSIEKFLRGSTSGSMPHGSLITALCHQAGVQWRSSELLQQPMAIIDHATIDKYKEWSGGISHPRGEGFIMMPPQAESAEPSNTAGTSSNVPDITGIDKVCQMVMRTNQRLDRIAKRQDEIYGYMGGFNNALINEFARLNPDSDISRFPSQSPLSGYPPSDEED